MTNLVQFPGLGLSFHLNRVAFTIGGVSIYWYGVCIAVGLCLALVFAFRHSLEFGVDPDSMVDVILIGVVLGIISARAYYVAMAPFKYESIWEMIAIRDGGLAIYGGIIGGFLFGGLACKWRGVPVLPMFDLTAMGFLLGQGCGRWGNFFNQEAFGLPISNGELMWFPFAVYIEGYHTFNGQPCSNPYHMATFFYESAWCLIVFIILWSCRKKFRHDGDAILSYAALYGLERMFVERLRGDSLYIIKPGGTIAAGVRVSEMLSLIVVASVAAFFIIRHFKEKKLGRLIWPAPEAEAEEAAAPDEADSAGESEKEEAAEEKPEPEETDQGDSTEDGQ